MSFQEGNITQVHPTMALIFRRDLQQIFMLNDDKALPIYSETSMDDSVRTVDEHKNDFRY